MLCPTCTTWRDSGTNPEPVPPPMPARAKGHGARTPPERDDGEVLRSEARRGRSWDQEVRNEARANRPTPGRRRL